MLSNKALYEKIMRNLSYEIKLILEDIQKFDVSEYEENSDDIIDNNTVSNMSKLTPNDLFYMLKKECEDIPEVHISKSENKSYFACIFFNGYYYKLLDNKIDIDSQGETWIYVSPKLNATIVSIGCSSGRRYTTSYGKFKSIQDLVDTLKKDIDNYREHIPVDIDNIKVSSKINRIANQLKRTKLNFQLPIKNTQLKRLFYITFEPEFYIYDRIYNNAVNGERWNTYTYNFPVNGNVYKGYRETEKIAKQIQYDFDNNEKLCVCLKFNKRESGYSDYNGYNYDQLLELAHKCMDYINEKYDITFYDETESDTRHEFFDEGSYYEVNLYGYGKDIINLIQKAIDIIHGYEQFINENFSKYIN